MEKSNHLFHWIPRVICILAILFVSMFALDAFAPELTIWQQLADFFIHLIPSFVLIALLILAWKWELIGGLVFTVIGLVLSPYVFMMNMSRGHFSVLLGLGIVMMITFPFVVAGILFIVSYFKRKRTLQLQ